ncbi:MAG TPA: xanthine dehydrogenase family protein subunit M [Terriglobia bacterium]|nr:xanthine dehydrogenase family protein subunit M [Terriglobia bacterium]
MIPEPFEYHVPKTIEEAAQLVAQFGDDGKVLAGGHSLVPLMKLRLASPRHLVDIARLDGLRYIHEKDGRIEIGALTTHYRIESSSLLKEKCPLLPLTAREIGDVQVRNKGTLGGSLAHADPAADWPAAAVGLGAEMKAVSTNGERWIPASEFFVDLMMTSLAPGEIVTAVRFPVLPPRSGDAYVKHRHPASGFAVVGVAARVTLDDKGHVQSARVGVTGIAPVAYRASGVEQAITGKAPTTKNIEQAASRAADGIEANGDLYASAEYRAHLVTVYTERALAAAAEKPGNTN